MRCRALRGAGRSRRGDLCCGIALYGRLVSLNAGPAPDHGEEGATLAVPGRTAGVMRAVVGRLLSTADCGRQQQSVAGKVRQTEGTTGNGIVVMGQS